MAYNRKKHEQYQDTMARLFPVEKEQKSNEKDVISLARPITFQVVDSCNLRCTYCYQINKQHHVMDFEIAKKFIDLLLSYRTKEDNPYINCENTPAIVIEFIGGEPFLAIDLIDKISDYFEEQMILLNHPWATRHRFSICSNGVLYFDPRVQNYLRKHKNNLSFSISIDGNKALHDSARLFPDGSGSYDIAMAGVKDYIAKGGVMGSKITLSPYNITKTFDAVKDIIENGYEDININCVYEKGWTTEHAKILYTELKKLADYIIDRDLPDDIRVAMFEENFFRPKAPEDNQNWCWGAGTLILTDKGHKPIEKIKIGDLVYTHTGELKPVIDLKQHFDNNVYTIKATGILPSIVTGDHKLFAEPWDYRGFKGTKHYKPLQKIAIEELTNHDKIHLSKGSFGTIQYDLSICYLVGRFLGDGYTERHLDGSTHSEGKSITCSFKETSELETYLNAANIRYSVNRNKTANQIHIYKTNIESYNNKILLDILADCGYRAEGKHIPAECLFWTKECLEALISGYLAADGYKKNNRYYSFNTVSRGLAEDLMYILRTLGYCPTCYLVKRANKCIIEGREVNQKNRYEVCFKIDKTSSTIKHLNNCCTTCNFKKEKAEPQIVYNLTVVDNHSYIANGLVSSNCGGNAAMLSCDWKGDLYPCIRYMESSLGKDQKPIIIGNVNDGLVTKPEEEQCMKCMRAITRKSQSTEECFNCPIAEGCSWCTAYNYQEFGTVDHRATYICIMHKARSLANVYFWNKWYAKKKEQKYFKRYLPDKDTLEIIDKQELELLNNLEKAQENFPITNSIMCEFQLNKQQNNFDALNDTAK